MIDLETAREICLSLPEATEQEHFGRPSYRVNKKIFTTLHLDSKRATVKFTPEQQIEYGERYPSVFQPVQGGWGKQGYTFIDLEGVQREVLEEAIKISWHNVAPKKLIEKFRDENK